MTTRKCRAMLGRKGQIRSLESMSTNPDKQSKRKSDIQHLDSNKAGGRKEWRSRSLCYLSIWHSSSACLIIDTNKMMLWTRHSTAIKIWSAQFQQASDPDLHQLAQSSKADSSTHLLEGRQHPGQKPDWQPPAAAWKPPATAPA